LLELLSGRLPTEDLLELFDTNSEKGTITDVLDKGVDDWVVEDASALLKIAVRCQEMLPTRRASVVQVLPQLEALLAKYDERLPSCDADIR
jgi:hypothetical protein